MVNTAFGAVMPLARMERRICAFSTVTAEIRGEAAAAPVTVLAVSVAVWPAAVSVAASLVKLPETIQPMTTSATRVAQTYEALNFMDQSPVKITPDALPGR
jgi:hypothetical protein